MRLLSIAIARVRIRLHCFLYLHQPSYRHAWISKTDSKLVSISCLSCGSVYWMDAAYRIEAIAFEALKKEREKKLTVDILGGVVGEENHGGSDG